MYSHCLFCKRDLGANEVIEHFPVGRRLAFDASKGRLWVICASCQRWNLTPIEERWEAIEEAERLYRGQRLRAQTDNIGVAKARDGTELVRIGPALRPEFAAWRYGRMFGRRMRRALAVGAGGTTLVAAGTVATGLPALIASVSFLPPLLLGAGYVTAMAALGGIGNWKYTRVVGQDGKPLRVYRNDMEHMQLLGGEGDDPYRVLLKHSYGRQELTGDVARRALGALLARVNRVGAASETVRDATGLIAEAGSAERAFAGLARDAHARTGDFDERWKRWQRDPIGEQMRRPLAFTFKELYANRQSPANPGALPNLPRTQRLALEMALHEDTEQRALEGELAILEAAWREAEEIAAIADEMFVPELGKDNAGVTKRG